MNKFEKNCVYETNNVLVLRKKMTNSEFHTEFNNMGKYLVASGLRKSGPIITATHSVEIVNNEQLLDMEIMIPIDSEVHESDVYDFKKSFTISSAIKVTHHGNPANLAETYQQLSAYIKENQLKPVSAAFNVNVKDATSPEEIDDMVVEIYLPVS